MSKKIGPFTGEYSFLSNFYPIKMIYSGIEVASSEHAYQMMKATNKEDKLRIASLSTPNKAKQEGKKIEIKENWNKIKFDVMRDVLNVKFSNPEMKDKLMQTGDAELIEYNYWNDKVWGKDEETDEGKNMLGKLLMEIRDRYKNKNTILGMLLNKNKE